MTKTEVKGSAEKEKKASATKKETGTVIYIGPDIPGTVKQNSVFNNGLPEGLSKKMEEVPAIKGLVIPVERLPASNAEIIKTGGALYILFQKVFNEIGKER